MSNECSVMEQSRGIQTDEVKSCRGYLAAGPAIFRQPSRCLSGHRETSEDWRISYIESSNLLKSLGSLVYSFFVG